MSALAAAIEAVIGEAVVTTARVGGGCINEAYRVTLGSGRVVFVKHHAHASCEVFEREAEGLSALRAVGAIRVPQVHGVAPVGGGACLVLEHLETAARPPQGYEARLGAGLAQLHRASQSARAGFAHDNFLGSSPQPNGWSSDWVEFFAQQRLGHQLRLAVSAGRLEGRRVRQAERLMARLGEILGPSAQEPMVLLHGDLWSGNQMADVRGEPVLIDPAAYYGHREAELSMTMLFGGFGAEFYAGYESVWPLTAGWRERAEVYGLYHLLNHLNLFGFSYLGACARVLERWSG